jgi:hypothetical protein
MAVLFISETYVKNNTVIDENVDMRLILPSIRDAQELRIHPILGTPLYEDLITKITASTLNADEIILLDQYIATSMLQHTLYECSVSMLFKYRNRSVNTGGGENFNPISYEDLQFLRDDWKNKAEERDKRLINYLMDNSSLYPAYTTASDDLNPRKTAYQTSFYLGGGRGDCWINDYYYYKDQ